MSVVPERDAATVPGDSYLASHPVSAPVNRPARLGLVLGAVALVINPVLLAGAAAVVLSVVGLRRAVLMGHHGYPTVGRSHALIGLGLGILATIVSITLKNALI